MAKSILKGVLQSEFLRGKKIILSDVDLDKLNETSDEYGVNVTNDNRYAAENSEYLLLAVKPQNFPDVAKQLS